jgi:SOS-response transcriptional repressor LexA
MHRETYPLDADGPLYRTGEERKSCPDTAHLCAACQGVFAPSRDKLHVLRKGRGVRTGLRKVPGYKDAGIAYVRHVLAATGWSGSKLAKAAGVEPSTINRPLRDPDHKFGFNTRTLLGISRASGIPLPAELGGPSVASLEDDPRALSVRPLTFPIVGGHEPSIDLPLRGIYDAAAHIMSYADEGTTPYIERPAFLLADTRAYASLVADDAMAPVYETGHTIYLSPSRPIAPGDDVLIIFADKTGLVRRFVRREDHRIVMCQFNPDKTIEFPAGDVATMHMVIASLRFRR